MKKLLTVAIVLALALFVININHRPAIDTSKADAAAQRFMDDLVPSAEAQVPTPSGGTPVSGAAVTAYATTTTTGPMTMLPAPAGANVRNYIYQATCVNTSASTAAVAFIKDGSTVLAAVVCPPAAASTGIVNFNPPLKQPTSAQAVTMTLSTAVTTAYFYMSGFTGR